MAVHLWTRQIVAELINREFGIKMGWLVVWAFMVLKKTIVELVLAAGLTRNIRAGE